MQAWFELDAAFVKRAGVTEGPDRSVGLRKRERMRNDPNGSDRVPNADELDFYVDRECAFLRE